MTNSKKGFTLVELLAVVVILGVLLGIAVPTIGTIITKSKKNSFVASAKNIINSAKLKVVADDPQIKEDEIVVYTLEDLDVNNSGLQGKIVGKLLNGKIEFFVCIVDVSNEFGLCDYTNEGISLIDENNINIANIKTIEGLNFNFLETSSNSLFIYDGNNNDNTYIYTKNESGKYEKDILNLPIGGILSIPDDKSLPGNYHDKFIIINQKSTTVELMTTFADFLPQISLENEMNYLNNTFFDGAILNMRYFTCDDLYKFDTGSKFLSSDLYSNACEYYLNNNFKKNNLLSKLFIDKISGMPYTPSVCEVDSHVVFDVNDNNKKYKVKFKINRLFDEYVNSYCSYFKYILEIDKNSINCEPSGECTLLKDKNLE